MAVLEQARNINRGRAETGGHRLRGDDGNRAEKKNGIQVVDVIPQPKNLRETEQNVVWRKAKATYGTGACVELAELQAHVVGVRDSKNPTGPVLSITRNQLGALLKTLKS